MKRHVYHITVSLKDHRSHLFIALFTNCLSLLLVLEIEVSSRSSSEAVATPRHPLSAVWCLVLRMLEVVAEFSLTRKWKYDLIGKWEEAFQKLVAMDVGQPHPVFEYHPGITLYSSSCLHITH